MQAVGVKESREYREESENKRTGEKWCRKCARVRAEMVMKITGLSLGKANGKLDIKHGGEGDVRDREEGIRAENVKGKEEITKKGRKKKKENV